MAKIPWKESATMMLVAKKKATEIKSAFNYKVLMLRRSGKSQFMPNMYVYPGGKIADSDFDRKWSEVFKTFGQISVEEIIDTKRANRPLLMNPRASDTPEMLNRELAFRICALRETFEESGIFLPSNTSTTSVPLDELAKWRKPVYEDPKKFLELCFHFESSPDIWSLLEWNDWLTPIGRTELGTRRFDTIFYTHFHDEGDPPIATLDEKEVTDVIWKDPGQILKESQDGKVMLAPPQVYELTRMSHVRDFEQLRDVTERRQSEGVKTFFPILMKTSDGIQFSPLPGDELYPEEPNYEKSDGIIVMDVSYSELNVRYPRANRMAWTSDTVETYVTTPDPYYQSTS